MARYLAESGLIKREGGQWVSSVGDSLVTQIPEGLRDVIGKRLSHLSEECNRVLSIAAVMGRDFSLDVLRAVAAVPEEQLLAAIEEAVTAALLEDHSQGRDVRYRFTHAYFRQTLYGEMIAPRRLRLHNEVAKALEQRYAGRLEDHAAELAEHFSHSSAEEDLSKAVHYGELAGRRAAAVYAHGEAARLIEQTLQVQEVLDPKDDVKRYDLLSSLADALLQAGEPKRVSDDVAQEMFAIAERLGGGDRAALAAQIGAEALGRRDSGPVFAEAAWVEWTERLYRHSRPGSIHRVFADVDAAWTHYARRRMREFWEAAAEALELDRTVGDPLALVAAMFEYLTSGAPPELEVHRAAVAREFAPLPRSGIRPANLALILFNQTIVFLANGDLAAADVARNELEEFSRRVGDPFAQTLFMIADVWKHRADGDIEGGVNVAYHFLGTAAGAEPFGQGAAAVNLTTMLATLGRLEEAMSFRDAWASFFSSEGLACYVPAVAGQLDEARREMHRLIAERGTNAEHDWTPVPTLVFLLATATITRDLDVVRMLHRRLSPFDRLYSAEAISTVARQLGEAELLLGAPAAARRHFEEAIEVGLGVADCAEVALARLAMARTLFDHYPDERADAQDHLNFALAEFQRMKMQPALEEAMRLRMRDQGISTIATDIYTSIDAVADSVQHERPDVRAHAAPDGTVTIMFSDIEDSTVLMERLGDRAWQDLLRRHNSVVREQIHRHGGFEVKTMGDVFMVAFQSAKKGLDCAIAIQRAFAAHNTAEGEHVRVRIGLHAGEAVKENDDFYGKNVNVASRVAGQAKGGEILVSALLRQLVESSVDASTIDEAREVELKGLGGVHSVHAVRWR